MGLTEDRERWNRRYQDAQAPIPPVDPHPLVLQFLHMAPRGAMLDAACGRGKGIAAALGHCRPCIGVDLSEVALHQVRRLWQGDPRVQLVCGDVNALQWPPAHFGLICAFGFTDWRFFRQIPKLLLPGGLFVYEGFSRRRLESHPDMDPAWTSTEAELRALAPEWPVLLFEDAADVARNRFVLQRPTAA